MPASYDGSVKIGVELDSSALKNSINELTRNVEKAVSSNDPKIQRMGISMSKLADNIQKTSDKMKELGATKIPTEQYKNLQSEFNKLEGALEKLGTESIKLQNGPQTQKAVKRLEEIETEADKLQTKLTYVEESMQKLQQTGQAFTMGSTTEEFKKLEKTLEYQKQQAAIANQEFYRKTEVPSVGSPQQIQQVNNVTNAFERLKGSTKSVFSTIKSIGSAIGRVASKGFTALRDKIRGIGQSSNETSKSLKKMFRMALKYVFGIRSIFILYRKIKSAGKEAFLGMASQFRELQAQVDSIKGSFFQLKNSLATAFQPIITAVIPILKTLISYIVSALTAIGNFFAVLTGQKYVYKATKANNGLAKSIGGTGKAADEANEKLAEYDNLLVIQQENESGGGGGGDAADAYAGAWEKVEAESDFAQKLKEAIQQGNWEELGGLLADKLNTLTKRLDDWINTKFRPEGKKWAKRIAQILNGLTEGWDSFLTGKTISDGLMALMDIIATFFETYHWKTLGQKVAGLINGVFTAWEPETVARFVAGKFNAIIHFLSGLVDKEKGIDFKLLGSKLGQTLKRIIEDIDWAELGADLSGLASGILQALSQFIIDSDLGVTVGNAINEFLSKIDFGQLARDLSDLAINLLNALGDCIKTINWKEVGQDIADFLKNIKWVEFLSTLVDVALALIKGLGTALLEIVTDPEALGSLATGLLAIFGSEWIWKKITGLFKTNIGSAIAEGASGAASGAGGAATGGLIGAIKTGLTTDVGALGSLTGASAVAATIGSGVAAAGAGYVGLKAGAAGMMLLTNALGAPEDLVDEYAKELEHPISYLVENAGDIFAGAGQLIADGAVATWENVSDIADGMMEGLFGPITYEIPKTSQEVLDAIQRNHERYAAKQKEILQETQTTSDHYVQIAKANAGVITATAKDMEETANHYVEIAKQNSGYYDQIKQEAIESSNHYVEIAQANAKAVVNTAQQAEESSNHYVEIAKANAGYYDQIKQNMIDSSNHYAEIAKANAKGVVDTAKQAQETSNHYVEIAKTNSGYYDKIQKDMEASSNHYVEIAKKNAQTVSADATEMVSNIEGSVATIPDSFDNTFTSAYDKVTSSFDGTKSYFNDVAEGVKTPFGTMADFFHDTFSDSWNGVVDVFQSNSPEFKTIQDSISGSFKTVINGMITGVNNSIASPFRTLSSLIEKMRNIDVAGNKVFSVLPGITVPAIPKLAQGAVLPPNNPFIAMVGDQKSGTNVEAPLETIAEALRQVLSESKTTQNQTIVLQLNGRQIAQAVWDEENKRYKQTGARFSYT